MSTLGQYRDQSLKSMQSKVAPDPFGMLGLLAVIRMNDPDLTSLALGLDLTTLGLNLNSTENLYKTFGSPWSDEPAKGDPEFAVPQCYYAKQPPPLNVSCPCISVHLDLTFLSIEISFILDAASILLKVSAGYLVLRFLQASLLVKLVMFLECEISMQ